MDAMPYEPIREPRRLWARMLRLIAASYLLDTALLALFVLAGALPAWVPPAYGAVGLACCSAFHALIRSGATERCADSNLTLAQLAAAASVQLAFMVLAPPGTLYFVSVLFIIFGFASLRLRPAEAAVALAVVAVALAAILARVPQALSIPHDNVLDRVLVGVAILLTLTRCTMLGLYGSHLRLLLGRRYAEARISLAVSAQRNVEVAAALHDDLGQQLAGTALLLAACTTRLRREGHPAAPEVATAAEHLRAAIHKTRALAQSAHDAAPMPVRRVG